MFLPAVLNPDLVLSLEKNSSLFQYNFLPKERCEKREILTCTHPDTFLA